MMRPDETSALGCVPESALNRFLERSSCPFVSRAQVFACAPSRPSAIVSAAGLSTLAADLERFLELGQQDLAVLEIAQAQPIDSPARAGSLLHALLAGLRERDPACQAALSDGIEDASWDFEFGAHSFFVSFFGAFYPDWHPRWSGERDVSFVLLQPERGFRRFGVSSHRPHRQQLSARVQERFELQGRPYDTRMNQATPKAMRYVKPIEAEDSLVAWWTLPYESARRFNEGSAEPR